MIEIKSKAKQLLASKGTKNHKIVRNLYTVHTCIYSITLTPVAAKLTSIV